MTKYKTGLVWLRRDYRLHDHTALNQALTQCEQVVVCFIFDTQYFKSSRK
jgi:Deoxyribodipyrimidine photolyase